MEITKKQILHDITVDKSNEDRSYKATQVAIFVSIYVHLTDGNTNI